MSDNYYDIRKLATAIDSIAKDFHRLINMLEESKNDQPK